MLDTKKIGLIHVAKKQLQMCEEDYRALLLRAGDASSASELTARGFNAVMAEFQRLGFVSTSTRRRPAVAGGSAPGRPTPAQWQLLEDRAKQAGYAGLDDPRFINWMKARAHVEHPRFMDMAAARRVIGALGKWLSKQKSTEETGRVDHE